MKKPTEQEKVWTLLKRTKSVTEVEAEIHSRIQFSHSRGIWIDTATNNQITPKEQAKLRKQIIEDNYWTVKEYNKSLGDYQRSKLHETLDFLRNKYTPKTPPNT